MARPAPQSFVCGADRHPLLEGPEVETGRIDEELNQWFVCWRGWQKNPPSPIEPDRELVRDRRPKMFPLFCVMRHRRPFDLDGSRRDEGRGHDPAVAASSMCEAG